MRSRAYSVGANCFGNVLELLLTAILEANVQLAVDLGVDLFRDQDAPLIGETL